MNYTLYTNSEVTIHAGPAMHLLTYKSPGVPSVSVAAADDHFTFQTGGTPGRYHYQITNCSGNVIQTGVFDIRQDLAHAPDDYDPRSQAAITLEALEAKIAGRALTIQQSKVSVDGRSIEYMNSIDELLKWRDYFARMVAKEEGRSLPKVQVCHLRRK